jgi:hypothetical protein
MDVKDLKQMLKGIAGDVPISTGNHTAYPTNKDTYHNTLHIDIYGGQVINTIKPKDVEYITFWFEE